MQVLRRGSAILVVGAGNCEVARRDGGGISWQAQYFVRIRRVDAELESRNCLAGLRAVCAPMGVSA